MCPCVHHVRYWRKSSEQEDDLYHAGAGRSNSSEQEDGPSYADTSSFSFIQDTGDASRISEAALNYEAEKR